jgi:hypothetical protein
MEFPQLPEQVFLQDIFRKDVYIIVFDFFDNYLDPEILMKLQEIDIDEIKRELYKTEFLENIQFEQQVDCIIYFDVIALWNVVEYTRKMFQLMKISSTKLLQQTTLQHCNLAWSMIAKEILYNEWEDIIECYRNR